MAAESRLGSILLGAGVVAVLAGALLLGRSIWHGPEQQENPFEYDISEFRAVDPQLLKYDELERVETGLQKPQGLAVTTDGRILVTGDGVLLIFSGASVESRIELTGSARCVAAGDDGRLYLGMDDHVEVWDRDGNRLAHWDALNERSLITSIAVDEDRVFVADAGNRLVLRHDLEGTVLARIGERDPERNIPGFVIPSPYFDLGIGHDGLLWVVNPGRHTLEGYGDDGGLRSSWGTGSMDVGGFSGCCNPIHMAMLANGGFVTSEKGLPRVKVYRPTGTLQAVVAAPEQFADDADGLDLAVDADGRILVLDPASSAVRVFVERRG